MKTSVSDKKTILIVEDDEVLLRALYLLFHNSNYTIASATDGDTAIKMAQRIKPDLILLDLMLPVIDGFGVLKTIKSDEALKNVPVIVLSNLGNTTDVEKAKSLGAIEYHVKANTKLEELLKKVEEIKVQKIK